MTNEQFLAMMEVLNRIHEELKKANKRPLYIVVNNQDALKELAKRIREDRSLETEQEGDKS